MIRGPKCGGEKKDLFITLTLLFFSSLDVVFDLFRTKKLFGIQCSSPLQCLFSLALLAVPSDVRDRVTHGISGSQAVLISEFSSSVVVWCVVCGAGLVWIGNSNSNTTGFFTLNIVCTMCVWCGVLFGVLIELSL